MLKARRRKWQGRTWAARQLAGQAAGVGATAALARQEDAGAAQARPNVP